MDAVVANLCDDNNIIINFGNSNVIKHGQLDDNKFWEY